MITVIGYAGFLIGPALIGGLAELTDLRTALSTILFAGLAIAASSIVVARARAAAASA